jgi:transposase
MVEELRSALSLREVPMVEPEAVARIRGLRSMGWGAKRIAREMKMRRNTVRRYLRAGESAEVQVRPGARRLCEGKRRRAEELFAGEAAGNAVVVRELLAKRGVLVSTRTVQRAVREKRQRLRAEALATVRYETAPGEQTQADFGEKRVWIGGALVRVFFLVAVLGFSRCIFVRAMLSERQGEWLSGLVAAFRHFGGVTRTLLVDNAGALVLRHDRRRRVVTFTSGFEAFCRDWGIQARACAPYRAQTKGKTESGVGYVKGNALAGRRFSSLEELQAHLLDWSLKADERIHGTTGERPRERFERERAALGTLPERAVVAPSRRLLRRVASDALVDVDTARYSVPHRLVKDDLEVLVLEDEVVIFRGTLEVARHRRAKEPRERVSTQGTTTGSGGRGRRHRARWRSRRPSRAGRWPRTRRSSKGRCRERARQGPRGGPPRAPAYAARVAAHRRGALGGRSRRADVPGLPRRPPA